MGDSPLNTRSCRRWRLPMRPIAVAVTLTVAVVGCQRVPPSSVSVPLRVQSDSWHVGAGVELTLQTEPPRAGRFTTLTLMSPGDGQPSIRDLSPEFFGLSGVQMLWLERESRETEMLLAAAAGSRYVGLDFDWKRLEPRPGRYDWKDADESLALAKRHSLRLVPMLLFTPRWASTASYAPLDYHRAPPANYADYRDFVYAVVNRYKPYGTSPLTDDGYGITDWVVWNEPNMRSDGEAPAPSDFWTGNLEEYLLLLRAGYEGAHAADPGCNVLNGGLADIFWAGPEENLAGALERLYDPDGDGDASDGGRPFFDTLNIHTYQGGTPEASWYEERLDAIAEVMERFGDAQKPIWITETGYGSLPGPIAESSLLLDEQVQADAVSLVYRAVAAYPQVERAFWWSLRDYYGNASHENEEMEAHYGLLRATYDPKPAYMAYGQLTGSVGKVLTLTGLTDEAGAAQVNVPASFVTRPGVYVVFVAVEGVAPTAVLSFEASAGEASQN